MNITENTKERLKKLLTEKCGYAYPENIITELQEHDTVNDCFQYLGNGSYKHTFELDSDWVIKFSIDFEVCDNEKWLLREAKEAGMEFMFPETYYLSLDEEDDFVVINEYLNSMWQEYYNDGFKYIILQEKCRTSEDVDEISCYPYDTISGCDIDENVEYILKKNNIDIYTLFEPYQQTDEMSLEWLISIIDSYGIETFKQVGQFIKEFSIEDLYDNNIGYTKEGLPVIFDWYSI